MIKFKGNKKFYYRLIVFEEYDKNWEKDFKTYKEAIDTYKNSKYLNGMSYEIIKFRIIENGVEE